MLFFEEIDGFGVCGAAMGAGLPNFMLNFTASMLIEAHCRSGRAIVGITPDRQYQILHAVMLHYKHRLKPIRIVNFGGHGRQITAQNVVVQCQASHTKIWGLRMRSVPRLTSGAREGQGAYCYLA